MKLPRLPLVPHVIKPWRYPRLVAAASAAILVLLWAYIGYKSMVHLPSYAQVHNQQLVKTSDEWIVKFDLINRAGAPQTFNIRINLNGEPRENDTIPVKDGGQFFYTYHVAQSRFPSGAVVTSTILRDGDPTPLDESTFYLR